MLPQRGNNFFNARLPVGVRVRMGPIGASIGEENCDTNMPIHPHVYYKLWHETGVSQKMSVRSTPVKRKSSEYLQGYALLQIGATAVVIRWILRQNVGIKCLCVSVSIMQRNECNTTGNKWATHVILPAANWLAVCQTLRLWRKSKALLLIFSVYLIFKPVYCLVHYLFPKLLNYVPDENTNISY